MQRQAIKCLTNLAVHDANKARLVEASGRWWLLGHEDGGAIVVHDMPFALDCLGNDRQE